MKKNDLNTVGRPPVVVVLGHVDHGKTTLLDSIRKTSVASREAGGITQAIGASVIETKDGKRVTFIDTPGHAAFTKMRGRGAQVADIAVLVVAQDDGVKPQTKEALEIIKDAKVPFLVAGTKADVAGVSPEKLQTELEKEGVFFEGRGGQVPFVSVSAKTNVGLTELVDMITLMAEVAEIKGSSLEGLDGVVIESGKDKMGPQATVVVQNGSIKVGDVIFAEDMECKVRAIFNDKGVSTKEVTPGEAARVFGFESVPQVGSKVSTSPTGPVKSSIRRVLGNNRRLQEGEIPVILKAGNAGALEAIVASLPEKIVVVDKGVGDVNSSDILTAKTGDAVVFAFEARIPSDVLKLAEAEKVKTQRFTIIYELLQAVEELLTKGKLTEIGRAEVLAIFPYNDSKVAGSRMISGRISKGDAVVLQREDKEIGKFKATSVKKQKQDVSSVGQGEEFGIILTPQPDFKVGDILISAK